mmetsp:Transcript_19663/g.47665  ORF Transcript_19663/g.47665 Transcript_19663/m.47665 type:complete len:228 (-) Transcript_19663:666-1349(-)
MPSSTAALVAFKASLRRSLVSLTATSLAPPTLITATPPLSLANRSFILSFSYSLEFISIASRIWSMRSLISAWLPEPPKTIVSSLVTFNVSHSPKAVISICSSFMPVSSDTTSPPVSTAMSCNMALRWSPKPGAFTAHTCSPPLSLFSTKVANASPSTSSATISRGRWSLDTCSSTGRILCTFEIFLSCMSTSGFVISTTCALALVQKWGEMNPRSKRMPSTTSSSW